MRSNRQTQQAFTLIEIMVVVVIIAAFVGLAVLGLSQAADRPVRAKARELESWLIALNDRATLEGTAYGLQASVSSAGTELVPVVWFRQHWFPVTSPEAFHLDNQYTIDFILPMDAEPEDDRPALVLGGQEVQGGLLLEAPDAGIEITIEWQADTGTLQLAESAG